MKITERKEKEKLIRRNSIIDAAEKVFFKNGFAITKVDDIALEAGFTKKTIYSYFTSKEEIYYSVMLRGFNILNSMCDKELETFQSTSEIEKIRIVGRCFINFSLEYPGYFKSIVDYQTNDIENKDLLNVSIIQQCNLAGEHCLEILISIIKKGIEKGEISSERDASTIALVLWTIISGFINMLDKKEQYIKMYYEKNASQILEDGFEVILGAIKKK